MNIDNFNRYIFDLKTRDGYIEIVNPSSNLEVAYQELYYLVLENSRLMYAAGVKKNECVLISMETSATHIVAFLSLMLIGAIPLSVKPQQGDSSEYLKYINKIISEHSVKKGINLQFEGLVELIPITIDLESHPKNPEPDFPFISPSGSDIAFIQFSSGSTSLPKPVVISHSALMHNLSAIHQVDNRSLLSVGMNVLPFCHDMGLVGGLLTNIYIGNSLITVDLRVFLRNPIKYLTYAKSKGVEASAFPEFVLRYLVKYLENFSLRDTYDQKLLEGYRTIYCGAEPIRYSTIEAFLRASEPLGLKKEALIFCYGMAETTLMVSSHRFISLENSFDKRATQPVACVGKVIDGLEIRIDEASGFSELHISGASLFSGYTINLDGPLKSAFATGDSGYFKNDNLYINGRLKDVLIVNGENIYAADIESHLLGIGDVRDAIVISHDETYDVVIVPKSRALTEIDVANSLANHFPVKPSQIFIVNSTDVIRTTSGKPMKTKTIEHILEKLRMTAEHQTDREIA